MSDSLNSASAQKASTRLSITHITQQLWRYRVDTMVAAVVAVLTAAGAIWGFTKLDFVHLASAYDTWFDADVRRVVGACEGRWTHWHHRTNVHPLYGLFISLPCLGLRKLGFDVWSVVVMIVAVSAFAFAVTFYAAARVLLAQRIDALLVTALMLSTSASIFWLTTPETYSLGAMTMLLAFVWLAIGRGKHDCITGPLQSLMTLSITTTNWMAGLAATLLALGMRRALSVSVLVLLAVVALNGVQKFVFPNAGLLFQLSEENIYLLPSEREAVTARLVSFVGQPLMAPEPKLEKVHSGTVGVVMSASVPTRRWWITWVAIAGWSSIFIMGLVAAFRRAAPQPLLIFLAIVLMGQVALHMVYGSALFLYSLHFAPFLVLVGALSCLSPWPKLARILLGITASATLLHNLEEFYFAAQLLKMTTTDSYFIDQYLK